MSNIKPVMLAFLMALAAFPRETAAQDLNWAEEEKRSTGISSRMSGMLLGMSLGSTFGMGVGRGFMQQEVERTESGWGYTIDYYSYEPENAHLVGAALGGLCGGILGYIAGRAADKKYYLTVPQEIREKRTKRSAGPLFGGMLLGMTEGGASGIFWPPESSESELITGEAAIFLGLPFWAVDSIALSGLRHRRLHWREWRESLVEQPVAEESPVSE
jgi:hypothetical protein